MKLHPLFRRRKIKIAFGVIVAIILLSMLRGCMSEEEAVDPTSTLPQVDVLDITPGLKRKFQTTGEVEAEKSANFLADFTSTVEGISVKIGDTVEEGQDLLVLQAREVEQDLTTANAVYITTSQNLAQTRITAQQSVDEAQIALKTAQINLEKLLKENVAKRKQAEETLNSATLNFGLSEASAQTDLENTIREVGATVKDALTYADELLEYSPVQEGLAYEKETHLGVRDPAQKLKAIDALNDSYRMYQKTLSTFDDAQELLAQVEMALVMLLTVLQNSVTSPAYTQATLNTNIETVNADIRAIRSLVSDLDSDKRALDSTMQKTGGTSQVLIDAEAAYETTMIGLEAAEKKAELDVERARSALESSIASAKANEISALTNVNSARGTLDQAQISSDKLIITAPFTGVVTDIPVRVGREMQPGELVLSMEDSTWLKVTTFVSVDEVKALSVGDIVTVAGEYEARIASVSPSADPQSKKYKVEVRLGGDTLLPGEFVTVAYELRSDSEEDSRLFLPVTAVHVQAAETYVWTVEEGTAKKQSVTIGELAGKYIEIVDGLTEGDRVVTEGGRALTREGQQVRIAND